MHRLALLALVPLVALVAACGSDDDAADGRKATTTTAPGGSGTDGGTGAGASSGIELLDPGAEPRRQVLIEPPADCEQRLTMTQEQELTQSVEGQEGGEQSTSTGMELDTVYRCTEVTAERIDADLTYVDARLTDGDGTGGGMQDLLDAFTGRTGHLAIDHHGKVLEMQPPKLGSLGDDQLDATLQSMFSGLSDSVEDLAAPFPSEPIGVGARWVQSGTVEAAGFRMRQRIEYHLTELDADHMTAEVTSTLDPVPGQVELPEALGDLGDSGDFDMRVESGHLEGTGTATWDLHGVASMLDQTMEGDVVMSISADGDALRLRQHQRQHQSLVPTGAS